MASFMNFLLDDGTAISNPSLTAYARLGSRMVRPSIQEKWRRLCVARVLPRCKGVAATIRGEIGDVIPIPLILWDDGCRFPPRASGRNHGRVTLLARKFMQRSVEGDQRRLQLPRIGQEEAISDRLRSLPCRERLGGLTEPCVQVARFGIQLHARVFEPTVINTPGFAECQRLVTHYGYVGEETQEPNLGISGKDQLVIVRQDLPPFPCTAL